MFHNKSNRRKRRGQSLTRVQLNSPFLYFCESEFQSKWIKIKHCKCTYKLVCRPCFCSSGFLKLCRSLIPPAEHFYTCCVCWREDPPFNGKMRQHPRLRVGVALVWLQALKHAAASCSWSLNLARVQTGVFTVLHRQAHQLSTSLITLQTLQTDCNKILLSLNKNLN